MVNRTGGLLRAVADGRVYRSARSAGNYSPLSAPRSVGATAGGISGSGRELGLARPSQTKPLQVALNQPLPIDNAECRGAGWQQLSQRVWLRLTTTRGR